MTTQTGLALRLTRQAAGVRVADLARAMGVSSQRISNIEALGFVTAEAAAKYLEALASLKARA